jgi:enediyne biosynthesis protein E4
VHLHWLSSETTVVQDVTRGHHWLKVKLAGVKSNRGAIGARVTARYGGKVQA